MSSGKIYKEIKNYKSLLSNSSKYEKGSSRGITPELTASWWSKLTFSWFSSFMDDAYEVEPDLDKLFDLPEFDTPAYKLPLFEKYWSHELKKHGFKSDFSENDFTENTQNKTNDLNLTDSLVKKSRISIILVLFKCFKIHFIITLFLVILSSFASLSQPIFLRKLLLYTKGDNLILYKPENSFIGSLWGYISGNKHTVNSNLVFQGFILIILITVLNIIHFLLKKQETLIVSNIGRYIRDLFTGLIYRKVLKMNSSIFRDNSNKQDQKRKLSVASVLSSNTANEIYGISGNLVNLLSNDISRFSRLYSAHEFYSSIISLTIAICLLYIYIGISGLAGVLVMIIHVILCVIALNYRAIERKPFLKVRDERILHISEYLSNVKIIKCYCWEDIFINKIDKIRQKEVKSLFIQGFYSALSFLCGGVVLHATLATIVVCSYMDQNIDQANIFFAYSMYDIICEILLLFPKSYAAFVDILLSCKRVSEFLLMEENKCNEFKKTQKQRNYFNKEFGMVLFENVDLYWSNGTLLLRNVSFEAVSGEITAVIGCIGSGKSGLLGAIAGEITPKGGKFECIGSVAYVTQVPWIFTGTIRENIILGSSYNVDWYNTVINACALKEDFSILPHGDHTMIGEGLNLSGGQKQRISLARAVYQKVSIYVLDDCLSALDPNVAAHILQECICGILKKSCIIFATHNLDIVSYAHRLLILDHHNKCPIFIREPKDLTSINDYESFIGSINTQVCSIYKKQTSNSQKVSEFRELKVSDRTTEKCISTYNSEFYEEEELKKGRISFNTYKSYIVAFGKINLLILIGLNFIGALIQVYGVFFIGQWSELYSTVDYGHALKVCIFISILFPLILILSWILIYYGGILVSSIYHNELLRYIKIAPFTFFEKTPIGRILNRFTSDLFLVDESLPQMFGNLVLAIIQFSVWSILTLYITPQLIFCIPIIIYLCYKVTKKYPPVIRQGERLSGVLLAPISSQVTETMTGLSTIRTFNSEDLFIKRMDKAITALSRVRYHMDIASCWLYLRLEIIGCIGLFCGGMFGVILVSFNSEYTQFLGFLLSFVITTSGWIRFIIFVLICLEADMIGLERIKLYVDNYISENSANLSLFKANKQCLSKGKVEFINLELKYGMFPILKNVNFYIEPGEKIGIVGRTGSGKSSMFTVLLRLVEPSRGIIKVDDIDISSIHTDELRRKIFIIPQDPVIFAGTIRFNIDPVSEYTDKEVLEALYRSNLHHTINSLPDGINYVLDSGGSNLSVGQKQLICLARAVLRKPKILLLDEATSSIDTYTESLIQETINREFQEATVLTIAHRIQTIIHSDKVMIINCGQIAEFDSPQNLINKSSGLFSSLVNASF